VDLLDGVLVAIPFVLNLCNTVAFLSLFSTDKLKLGGHKSPHKMHTLTAAISYSAGIVPEPRLTDAQLFEVS
jgi:hypothetical protein